MSGHAGATAARVDSGGTKDRFRLWLLVDAILATAISTCFAGLAVAHFLGSGLHRSRIVESFITEQDGGVSTTRLWWTAAALATIAVFAWCAYVGRRRAWTDGVTTLLGIPAWLLVVVSVLGLPFFLLTWFY